MHGKYYSRLISVASASFFCLILSFGCSKDASKPGSDGSQKTSKAQNVSTLQVEGRTVVRSVEATGTLAAGDEAVVSNEGPGTVGRIAADLGDHVKTGGTLAVLDQREARLALAEAEAALATNAKTVEKENARYVDAKTSLDRYEELFKKEMVSQSQYDTVKTQFDVAFAQYKEAQSRYKQSEAHIGLARKRVSDTTIVSPIDGVVKKRFVSQGEALRDRTPMFMVVSAGPLKFRGTVAEPSVPDVKTGQKVTIIIDAFRDADFSGTLSRVSPALNVDTRTLDVEAIVPNPDGLLKPGYFAKGIILTRQDEAVPFVPESAIYSFVGINKVFLIDKGVVRERMVKIGRKDGAMTEIIGDIKPGDTIASSGLAALYDGAPVAVAAKK